MLNLLSAHTLIAAQSDVLRRARPLTMLARRLLVTVPWIGYLFRDLHTTLRRLGVRSPRDTLALVLVGRQLGEGKNPASEAPAQTYNFSRKRIDPEVSVQLAQLMRTSGTTLTQEELGKIAELIFASFAHLTWFRSEGPNGVQAVGVPRLGDVPEHRAVFLKELAPPPLSEAGSFDGFLRAAIDGFTGNRDLLGLARSAVEENGEVVVDRKVVAILGMVAVAATEFGRRAAAADRAGFVAGQARLWAAYDWWYAAMERFMHRGSDAEEFYLESGRFLRICFGVCGRREVRDLHWAQRRERDRWKITRDPGRRAQEKRLTDVIRSSGLQAPAAQPNGEQGLFNVCVKRCAEVHCTGNWDIGLLLGTGDLKAVCRFIAVVCRHSEPSSYERVVGIARSGLTCASVVSFGTGKPLSLLYADNVLDLVPQPALFERWLLIDDAYQTGYTYQLVRSQVFGLQAEPAPTRVFVALKAKGRVDSQVTTSFNLTARMEEARQKVGYAVQYECLPRERYPHLSEGEDRTLKVPDQMVSGLERILTTRLLDSRQKTSDDSRRWARENISQYGFLEVGLLFDSPDMVLSLGYELYRRTYSQSTGPVAFLCGSAKTLPFVAAACLHASVDGKRAPLILRCEGARMRYPELLIAQADELQSHRIVFVDESAREGLTYRAARIAVQELNRQPGRARPFVLDPGFVFTEGWPARRGPVEHEVLLT
jgi:hypothetical protein